MTKNQENVLLGLMLLVSFFFGIQVGTEYQKVSQQDVNLTRSLIKLADEACKNYDGAKTVNREMIFICNDGTEVRK